MNRYNTHAPFLLVSDNDTGRQSVPPAAASNPAPQWWPAEYEALSRWKRAELLCDARATAHYYRRLQNILGAKRRWQSRNNVVSMTGVRV